MRNDLRDAAVQLVHPALLFLLDLVEPLKASVDSGKELGRLKRLRQVVVRALRHALAQVFCIGLGR